MKIAYSEAVIEALVRAPEPVQKAFFKQVRFLASNLLHECLGSAMCLRALDQLRDLARSGSNGQE